MVNDIAEAGTWEYAPTIAIVDVPLGKLGEEDKDLLELEKATKERKLMKIVDLKLYNNYY